MDARETLPSKATFTEILHSEYQSQTTVHLIMDVGGLVRAEGIIKTFSPDSMPPWLELESGLKIELQKIIAVNGLFLPEYAEC